MEQKYKKMKMLISLIICSFLTSCSFINANPFMVEEEKEIQVETIEIFKDMIRQGWKVTLVNDQVFLVKYKDNKVLVFDVFNLLNGE